MARRKPTTAAQPAEGVESDGPPDRPIDEPERGPATASAPQPERVVVEQDTLVERPDLGAGRHTFVAKGDAIPLGLEGYPRTPA